MSGLKSLFQFDMIVLHTIASSSPYFHSAFSAFDSRLP